MDTTARPAAAGSERSPDRPGGGRSETKDRILDAAERLFAENGIQGTSLRAVTAAAGVNVAAVHYHFGSKEELVRALVLRSAGPVNRERLALLDALEATGTADARQLLDALFRPAIEAWDAQERVPMMAFLFTEPADQVTPVLSAVFGEVTERFCAALARALPELDPPEVAERFHLLVGMMVHVLSGRHERALAHYGGESVPRSADDMTRLLIETALSGLGGRS